MLLVCDDCTTAYSPGAPACPHCGGTDHHDQGTDMPKSNKRGPSNAAAAADTGTDEQQPQDPPAAGGEAGPPAASAPKADWQAYAEGLGADETVLAGTKAEIQAWTTDRP